jgi:hypothetical protein
MKHHTAMNLKGVLTAFFLKERSGFRFDIFAASEITQKLFKVLFSV